MLLCVGDVCVCVCCWPFGGLMCVFGVVVVVVGGLCVGDVACVCWCCLCSLVDFSVRVRC